MRPVLQAKLCPHSSQLCCLLLKRLLSFSFNVPPNSRNSLHSESWRTSPLGLSDSSVNGSVSAVISSSEASSPILVSPSDSSWWSWDSELNGISMGCDWPPGPPGAPGASAWPREASLVQVGLRDPEATGHRGAGERTAAEPEIEFLTLGSQKRPLGAKEIKEETKPPLYMCSASSLPRQASGIAPRGPGFPVPSPAPFQPHWVNGSPVR